MSSFNEALEVVAAGLQARAKTARREAEQVRSKDIYHYAALLSKAEGYEDSANTVLSYRVKEG